MNRRARGPESARHRLWLGGALALVSVAVAAAQTSRRDYPQWRGIDRDGAASAFTEPAFWPQALTRRWRVDVGEGYATPLVVAETVYVFARRNGNEVMTALDAATGPKATPLFHDGRLFTLGMTGIVAAFEAETGRLAWQTPAAEDHPTYGMAVSPLSEGDLVIVHPGDHGPLTALHAATGAVRWSAPGCAAYASPIVVETAGVRQVVTMTDHSVLAVSVADGTRLWEHPWPSRGTPSAITPIQHGDTLIVGSQGRGLSALRPSREGGV